MTETRDEIIKRTGSDPGPRATLTSAESKAMAEEMAQGRSGSILDGVAPAPRVRALERLKVEQANGDTEAAHSNADDVLCELLTALGYADVVAEYEKVEKWFA